MTLERFQEVLEAAGFEPVECFYREYYRDRIDRILSLKHCGGSLSDGIEIVFVDPQQNKTPAMEVLTFDSETVELTHEVTEAIANCITHFEEVWNHYHKGTTK